MRRPLVAVLASAAVLVPIVVVGWLTSPASAASGSSPDTITDLQDMVVDAADGLVFISEGTPGAVLVDNTAGQPVTTFGGLDDPTQLVYDPASSTVYVALAAGDGIEAIDTTTLTDRFIPTTGAGCLQSLGLTEGLLWFEYGCAGDGSLGAVDPADGTVSLDLNAKFGLFADEVMVSDSADLSGVLVFGSTGSPTYLSVVKVTGGTEPHAKQTKSIESLGFSQLRLSPDGSTLLLAGSQGLAEYNSTTLQQGRVVAGDAYTVAERGDGMLAVAGFGDGTAQLRVYVPGQGGVYRTYEDLGQVDQYGLAFGITKLFAVINGTMHVIVPKHLTTLTLHANHPHFAFGGLATVTAHLGSTFSNRKVTIYATPYGGTRRMLRSGVVDSAGNLAASTHVIQRVTFSAQFAGDSQSSTALARSTVTVSAHVTDLLHGFYGTSGSYHLYHPLQHPIETTTVAPNRAGGCVYFHAQFRFDGGPWGYDEWTSCVHLDSGSHASVKLVGKATVGEEVRIVPQWRWTIQNGLANGTWRYIRFTS